MKSVLTACLFLCVAASAQSPAQQAVRARDDQYLHASLHKVRAELEDVFDPTFIDTSAVGKVRNKEQQIAVILAAPAFDSLTERDVRIEIYNGDSAVVTGQFDYSLHEQGKAEAGRGRFTDVWAKRGGRWYCVAAHSSDIPDAN